MGTSSLFRIKESDYFISKNLEKIKNLDDTIEL